MAVKALLTYRNIPSQQTGVLSAIALFGRPIWDYLPLYCLRTILNDQQMIGNTSGKSKHRAFKRNPKGPRQLKPLDIGAKRSLIAVPSSVPTLSHIFQPLRWYHHWRRLLTKLANRHSMSYENRQHICRYTAAICKYL